MLTAHPEMQEQHENLGCGQYGRGGGGDAAGLAPSPGQSSEQGLPPLPPPPPQRDPNDPSISAKKLPKKRKFDPSELEEMNTTNSMVLTSIGTIVGGVPMRVTNVQPLHQTDSNQLGTTTMRQPQSPSRSSHQQQQQTETYQVHFRPE